MDENGKSYIYGYVPIVVAKCGVFLKEKGMNASDPLATFVDLVVATDVEGIFRLSGSAKRIKELQAQFDAPTRFGKGLDWTGYTVHDAANVLRRYLNQLPQPIVPLEVYEKFRNPLRDHQTQAVGDIEARAQDVGDFDHEKAVVTYQQLITEMPPLNRQLLLYVLDLLSVFASKSDINRMTSANLAAIFQPGMLSHPVHDMKPQEYRLSQDVLIFLIDNQDSFLFGMSGTAADEKTVKEIQSGAPTPQATTPTKATSGIGRSASTASAGADSQKRFAGIRRNLSVSSRNSRNSNNTNAPNTPSSGQFTSSSGVYRSNTVPSKKSPALSSRMARGLDSPNTPGALSPALASPSSRSVSPGGSKLAGVPAVSEPSQQHKPLVGPPPVERASIATSSTQHESLLDRSKEQLIPGDPAPAQHSSELAPPIAGTPGKSKNFSGLLKSSPTNDGKEGRQPNKLRKKRMPSSAQPSANSSTHSLQNEEESPRNAAFFTPMVTPGLGIQPDPMSASQSPNISSTAATPLTDRALRTGDGPEESMGTSALEGSQQPSESTLKPKSPSGSVNSKTSVTDFSEQELGGDGKTEKGEKKRRWRFSSAPKKNEQPPQLASPPLVGTNRPADASSSSVGSWHKPRKSYSNDAPSAPLEPVASDPRYQSEVSENSGSKDRDTGEEVEKKGLFGRIRNKLHHAKEERKEKELEKERAKSPPRNASDRNHSKQSLSAIAQDVGPSNGPVSRPIEQLPEAKTEPKVGAITAPPTQAGTTAPIQLESVAPSQHQGSVPALAPNPAPAPAEPAITLTEPVTAKDPEPKTVPEADSAAPKEQSEPNTLFR